MRYLISNISSAVVMVSVLGVFISLACLIIRKIKKKSLKLLVITGCCFLSTTVLFSIIGSVAWSGTAEGQESLKRAGLEREEKERQKALEKEMEEEQKRLEEEQRELERQQKEEEQRESEEQRREEEIAKAENDSKSEDTENKEPKDSESNESEKPKEFLDYLKEVLDDNVAEKAYDILKNQIGFSNFEYKGKMEGLTNYEIKADGYSIILTASDDVYRIFIPSSSYVFYEDEEVKLTLAELESKTIDQYDRDVYYIMAQDIVCSGLKNPSSAKFPSIITHPEDILMQKNGDIVAVQSYVDAKNDFGAKVKDNWVVEFEVVDMETYTYNLIYANIGGQEYGEFIGLE